MFMSINDISHCFHSVVFVFCHFYICVCVCSDERAIGLFSKRFHNWIDIQTNTKKSSEMKWINVTLQCYVSSKPFVCFVFFVQPDQFMYACSRYSLFERVREKTKRHHKRYTITKYACASIQQIYTVCQCSEYSIVLAFDCIFEMFRREMSVSNIYFFN